MFSLIIWEQVPETTDLFLIPNSEIDDEMRAILTSSHGKLINAGDDDVEDVLKLNAALLSLESVVDEEHKPYHGRFVHHKVEGWAGPVIDTHVTHIYLSGWIL